MENELQKLLPVSGGHLSQAVVPEDDSIIQKVHDTDAMTYIMTDT